MSHTVKRKLTTIFCADVVGYSKLMGADEHGTLVRLKQCRELIAAFIERHHGRVVSWSGDAVLADFSSVVESVQCAVEIQRELKAQNESLQAGQRMAFRIGVNLGDVMIDDHDIFGEGVNIASRLQSLAPPGGILVSGSVHDQVKNKISLGFNFLGHQQVKNIAEQVPAYVVMHETATSLPISGLGGSGRSTVRAAMMAPAQFPLRIFASAIDIAFAAFLLLALTVVAHNSAGPLFAIDAPFTLLARERLMLTELPRTEIENGGQNVKTVTRSTIERTYYGLAKQIFERSETEITTTKNGNNVLLSRSAEEVMIDPRTKDRMLRLPLTLGVVVAYFVLIVLFEGLLLRGASPGKLLMGIRVSPIGNEAMDLNRAALRNLGKILSIGTALIGVFMALWSKRRQMLHDLLSGTYVHDAK